MRGWVESGLWHTSWPLVSPGLTGLGVRRFQRPAPMQFLRRRSAIMSCPSLLGAPIERGFLWPDCDRADTPRRILYFYALPCRVQAPGPRAWLSIRSGSRRSLLQEPCETFDLQIRDSPHLTFSPGSEQGASHSICLRSEGPMAALPDGLREGLLRLKKKRAHQLVHERRVQRGFDPEAWSSSVGGRQPEL